MTIIKVEGGVEAETNTFSITSEEIAKRLLQGWTMLNSVCSICHETPLLKQKKTPHRFCARCNMFIKIESDEDVTSSASTAVEETKKEKEEEEREKEQNMVKEKLKDGRNDEGEEKIEKEMESYSGHKIYWNKIEPSDNKENEPSAIDLFGRINSDIKRRNNHFFTEYKNVAEDKDNNTTRIKDPAKYIKEIKLQTGEFDEFMNNCTIPQMETTTLMDLNKYINEKCGNCFTDYLNLENRNKRAEDDIEEEEAEIEEKEDEKKVEKDGLDKDENNGVEMKIESVDNELRMRRYSYRGNIISNCKKLENESFVFAKVRYALMTILEKYAEELIVNSKKNHDVELITKMTQVTTLLEKISNLSKTLKI